MSPKPFDNGQQQPPLNPLAFWLNGFEYAFGFQLKLLQDYFGLSDSE